MATIKCVLGAPCSGKSTYVREHFKEGDIVWDFDEIKRAVILSDVHAQGSDEQNQMIRQMRYTFAKHAADIDCETAWFISTRLSDSILDAFGVDVERIEMNTTEEECYERLEKDATRADKEYMRGLIYDYFHGEKEGRAMPVMTNDREYRDFVLAVVEPQEKETDDRMVVRGYASTFNDPYELFEFDGVKYMEQIDARAFDEADMSDVIFQYNHEGRVFARQSNGTLSVAPDDHGLAIEADLGGTEIGRGLYEEIKGGYTNKMSFGFRVLDDMWEEKLIDGDTVQLRTITKVGKVYDVSAVSIPANDATSISVRNLSDGVIAKIQAERLEALELEKRKLLLKITMLQGGNQNGKHDH